MVGFFIFILGMIIGSFLNVCIYRIPKGESLICPASYCENCRTNIMMYDMIPVFSYIILHGRCRNCNGTIPVRYAIIEFLSGLVFLLMFHIYGLGIVFLKYCTLVSILIVIAVIDYDTTDIYLSTVALGIVFSIAFILIYICIGIPVKSYILGGVFGGSIFLLLIILTRGAMGLGDMEIITFCGMFLGIKLTVLLIFLSFLIGSICGTILILMGKNTMKDYIPFAPYILIATVICASFGTNIFNFIV